MNLWVKDAIVHLPIKWGKGKKMIAFLRCCIFVMLFFNVGTSDLKIKEHSPSSWKIRFYDFSWIKTVLRGNVRSLLDCSQPQCSQCSWREHRARGEGLASHADLLAHHAIPPSPQWVWGKNVWQSSKNVCLGRKQRDKKPVYTTHIPTPWVLRFFT